MKFESEIKGSKRIAINTIVSYGRTLLSVCLVLFSSRWTLQQLGAVDYGLYNLIGSILLIVVFLNTVISNGDSRFFALGIGRGDEEELSKVFNTSLSIHLFMPAVVVLIGIFIGEWAIRDFLVVPVERLQSTLWVFRITMFTSFFTMIAVPFSSLFIAYQNIVVYTFITFTQTILVFLSAYLLRYFNTDKLVLYAILVAFSQIITYSLQIVIASRKYKCAKINTSYFFNRYYTSEIIKFSFWNMLGDLGHLVRTQGISIIVNLYFGPKGNAALGIANQVSMQACNLTNAMSGATAPEIYRRAGEHDFKSAAKLADYTSKIGVFLMCLLGIPISLNIDSILHLWLVDVPEGTSILCFCFIIMFVAEKLTMGQQKYLSAIGKVALVNCLIFAFYCSSVLLPFMGLLNYGLLGIGISCIVSMGLSRLSIVYCMKKYTDYGYWYFVRTFLVPMLFVATIYSIIDYFYVFDSNNLLSLLFACMISCIFTFIICGMLLFTTEERNRILGMFVKKIRYR